MVGGKAVTVSGLTILTVENTGDDGVWVMRGQTANERDCVLVGAHDRRFLARQIDVDIGEAAAAPPQGEAGAGLGPKNRAEKPFAPRSPHPPAIACPGGRGVPHPLHKSPRSARA